MNPELPSHIQELRDRFDVIDESDMSRAEKALAVVAIGEEFVISDE